MAPLTDDELAAGLAACEAATPGPWHAADRAIGWEVHCGPPRDDCWSASQLGCDVLNDDFRETFLKVDAAFIALARDLLPRALRELEAWRNGRT